MHEQRGVKNTYSQDFEYLEVNEQDLNLLSDPEVASVNSHGADTTAMIETDNKHRKTEPPGERVSAKTGSKASQEGHSGASKKHV